MEILQRHIFVKDERQRIFPNNGDHDTLVIDMSQSLENQTSSNCIVNSVR